MSEAVVTKLLEVFYVLFPIAMVMIGIVLWENSQIKKKSQKEKKQD